MHPRHRPPGTRRCHTPTTTPGVVFEVRDFDLADRPALARAGNYDAALRAVRWLHGAFFDQLDANGEGAAGMSHGLIVVAVRSGGTPRLPPVRAAPGPKRARALFAPVKANTRRQLLALSRRTERGDGQHRQGRASTSGTHRVHQTTRNDP